MEAAGAEDTRLPVPALHISSITAGCRTRPPHAGEAGMAFFRINVTKRGHFAQRGTND